MKTIDTRLSRLEGRIGLEVDEEGMRLVALLLARRRRWAEERGEPVEVCPRASLTEAHSGPSTLVDILQGRRRLLAEADRDGIPRETGHGAR